MSSCLCSTLAVPMLCCCSGTQSAERRILIVSSFPTRELLQWVIAYAARRGPPDGKTFCAVSYARVRYWLRKGLVALKLPPDSFRTHSCRRGGATALSMSGTPFVDVQLAGRWASAQSCKLYIKRAEVALTRFTHTIPSHDWHRLEAIADIGERVFDFLPG